MSVLAPHTKATVLVVDDTPDNLALMSGLLKDDYRVKVALGGEKALVIAASDPAPDLILLDIMMPGMDGYEVCRRLKQEPATATIPVIFLTARADAEDEERGLALGAVDYITRPISPPVVLARVKNHLALKALADFLQEKNVELQAAKVAADKANLAKSEFLSSMSHELRSPLNAILGFAQLLESESPPLTPSQNESTAQILQAGWHLLKLIDEILDLSKVESGLVSLSVEPVSLPEVLQECQAMIEAQAQTRGIGLTFPDFPAPCFILADRTRLKQVLLNLLSNAIKYNVAQGKVTVTCAENTPGILRVSVGDTGAGLSEVQLAQLFQAFNRLGQEAGGVEGTGIGLVVAKALVEQMGGAIGAESTVGRGSVFWFELLSAVEPQFSVDESAAALRAKSPEAPDPRGYTLLYVEDDPANLMLVEKILSRSPNLHLLTAVDGQSGLAIARNSLPDLILMDINLPDISGLEALRILRADPTTAHIPVIAVSANAMTHDVEHGLEAGFITYLTKPINVDEFMKAVQVVLKYALNAQ